MSDYVPLTHVGGKVSSTAAQNTLGMLMYIDPTRYSIPVTRNLTVTQRYDDEEDVNNIYVRFRRGFQGVNDSDSGYTASDVDDGVSVLTELTV